MPKSLRFHLGQKKLFQRPFIPGNLNNREKLLCLAEGQYRARGSSVRSEKWVLLQHRPECSGIANTITVTMRAHCQHGIRFQDLVSCCYLLIKYSLPLLRALRFCFHASLLTHVNIQKVVYVVLTSRPGRAFFLSPVQQVVA